MKYDQIGRQLRSDIVSGHFGPGTRLPTRAELMRRFSTTNATIQNAMNGLLRDGMVETRGRKGTFVADRPPCLFRIGVAVPAPASEREGWDPLWRSVCDLLPETSGACEYDFQVYTGIEADPGKGDTPGLLQDIEDCRLGGLVTFWPSEDLIHRFERPGFQHVCIGRVPVVDSVPRVWVDYCSLIDQALDCAETKGIRRVALMTNAQMHPRIIEHFVGEVRNRGMETRPYWVAGSCLCEIALPWVARQIEMLLAAGGDACPEAIVVLNEQMVPFVQEGLRRTAPRLRDHVSVIAHANFPAPHPVPGNVQRVGFDVRCLLETVVGTFRACQRGDSVPALQELPAIPEHLDTPTGA